mmetsp:Transcript_47986/g.150583  ORF Transcript_47986/g.150583 Transcript_47986/m.150583 type:complete len:116 (+) Transcript_47986:530-877(+)
MLQVRTPFRVEARLLELEDKNHLDSRDVSDLSSRRVAALGPQAATSKELDEDGRPLFSVIADCGRVTTGRSPKPVEPSSTGIHMRMIEEQEAEKKVWSGRIHSLQALEDSEEDKE